MKKMTPKRKIEDFFTSGLAAQKAHFQQEKEFYRLPETPLLILLNYNYIFQNTLFVSCFEYPRDKPILLTMVSYVKKMN